MERRTHFIFGGLILLCLIGWGFSQRSQHTDVSSSPEAMVAGVEQPKPLTEAEIQRQFAIMERDKQSYAANLTALAEAKDKLMQAGSRTREAREMLRLTRSDDWSKFLHIHWQDYLNLRAKAAASARGDTPCTICDGRGTIVDPCFLCGGTGKCPTCNGTGKVSTSATGELCPACLGSGKCYLCGGTGKMICPFCDDGMIDSKSPLLPGVLPLVPPPYH